jgi:hypothetical protein
MDTMIKQRPTLFAVSIACLCLIGCATTDSGSSLESKAARMSPELLRSQVLRYKALMEESYEEEKMAALAQIFNTLAPKDAPYTPKTAKSISKALEENPELNEWNAGFQENLQNYQFFYKKLQDRGGDMTGLELDIPLDRDHIEQLLPPEQDYNKPGSPPIKETPNPHSPSPVKEPA